MMWQQLQLATAVRISAARDQARSNMAAAKASATSITPPSSSAISSTRGTKRPVDEAKLDEEWKKLGEWATPTLPQPANSLDSEDNKAFREATHAAISSCLQLDLAASTVKTYESLISHEIGLASKQLNIDLLPMVTEAQFSALFGSLLVTYKDGLKWYYVPLELR